MSLRRRLVVAFLAIGAVLIVTNLALSNTFESMLLDRVDSQLADVAERAGREGIRRPANGQAATGDRTLSEYFIAVGAPGSSTYVTAGSFFGGDAGPPPRLTQEIVESHLGTDQAAARPFNAPSSEGGGSWRVVARLHERAGVITVVGVSLAGLEATTGRVRGVQAAGTFAVLAALGLVSWWMVRLGIQPIENMARTADAIAAGDLSHRVDHPGGDTEAGRLGVALNSMLARIEGAFRAQEASEGRVRRFAADASHELRTPLTSIRGYAELWRAGGLRDDAELVDAMRRIEQEASRMGALVEDLLVLARLDQGPLGDVGSVRLDEIAADAVRDALAVEPQRVIELSADPVTVEGDEMGLRQVMANILANARTHTPVDAAVRVSVSGDDRWARLRVADDGPGMSAEVLDHVFERFYRADEARGRAAASTGLGLSIVAAIAEAHGGRAWAESEPGAGSAFVVELPTAAPSEDSANPQSAHSRLQGAPPIL